MRRIAHLVAGLALAITLTPAAAPARATTPYRLTVPATGAERGTVLLIHGGAWAAVGQQYADELAPLARRFARWGWRAESIDYRQGRSGLQDVLHAYDAAAERAPEAPICVYGESAGGTWALLLAHRRPSLDCVIDAAGPTDLDALPTTGLAAATRLAALYWFREDLAGWSPVSNAVAADVTLLYETDDPQVPFDQGLRLLAAHPDATLVALQPGPVTWLHGAVDRPSLRAVRRAERAALRHAER